MNVEAAIVFLSILGSLGFFFLALPLAVTLASLPRMWRERKGVALLLAGLTALTAGLFAVYLAGLGAITFQGKG